MMPRKRKKKNQRARNAIQHFVPKNYVLKAETGTLKVKGGTVRVEAKAPTVRISQNQSNNSSVDDETSKKVRSILGLLFIGLLVTVLSKNRDETTEPPTNAVRLLSLFLRGDEREAVIGDLVEKYRKKYHRLGKDKADRWIYGQVIWSIFPLLIRMGKTVGWFILGEWIKKHIS